MFPTFNFTIYLPFLNFEIYKALVSFPLLFCPFSISRFQVFTFHTIEEKCISKADFPSWLAGWEILFNNIFIVLFMGFLFATSSVFKGYFYLSMVHSFVCMSAIWTPSKQQYS